ncbi:hypothetical protein [Janthinobacterium sp. HLX7-2]|uniref:hypothetical protein n=1 Tax=Janthinobacterium sp. HLX7-2 TaxID=1259331 RepID=UPI003F240F9A
MAEPAIKNHGGQGVPWFPLNEDAAPLPTFPLSSTAFFMQPSGGPGIVIFQKNAPDGAFRKER